MRSKLIAAAAAAGALLLVVGAALADTQSDVAAAKHATAKYRSLSAAKKAGYTVELKTTPENGAVSCITDDAGGMGVHMVNPALLDAKVAVKTPEAVLYQPRGKQMQLIAVEYVVDRKAWHGAGNTKPPKLFGRQFSLTTKNKFGLKPFYALHAWIWKKNPAGLLQPWNPKVSCP